MEEKRNKWAEGRRWYDANRAASLLVYGVFSLSGFIVGYGLCYIILTY
jgi:hypothetical protein